MMIKYLIKAKNEEQVKLAEEIMEQYQAATTEVKKLEMELDDALREKVTLDKVCCYNQWYGASVSQCLLTVSWLFEVKQIQYL